MASERLRKVLQEFDARLESLMGPVHPVRLEIRKVLDQSKTESGENCGILPINIELRLRAG